MGVCLSFSMITKPKMAYDVNGNLTKDLDRDIVTIKYNLLNLPEIIQFKNGNQIRNTYYASGQKLNTRYFTVYNYTSQPILTVGEVYDISDIVQLNDEVYVDGDDYIGNIEYGYYGDFYYGQLNDSYNWFKRVSNQEGYVDNLYYTIFNYYRRDHLGNNREVWRAPWSYGTTNVAASTIQRTQYYPSGLPWASNSGDNPWMQNKKYNGKEFVEMHGLDEYDSEARWFYPAIMRTTTIDPLAEKYYSISPYAWCGNNPENAIDPDGMDIWEVNNKGEIVNRIKDKTQDAFYMVAKDADGKYQRTYATDKEGNKTFNTISFEYGTIESQKKIKLNSTESFDVYKVRGDENGTKLFEFMGEHVSGSGSLVEVSQIKTGIEGDKGLNFISTSHQERKESGQSQLFVGQLYTYTIREMNHTHPTNLNPSGLDGDEGFSNSVTTYLKKYGLNVPTFNIYHVPTKKYIPFGK
jgi:RHS repeat-associated protein